MKKLALAYTTPVFSFLFMKQINRKELKYGYVMLGGALSVTS